MKNKKKKEDCMERVASLPASSQFLFPLAKLVSCRWTGRPHLVLSHGWTARVCCGNRVDGGGGGGVEVERDRGEVGGGLGGGGGGDEMDETARRDIQTISCIHT